jgi:hypothetical protein
MAAILNGGKLLDTIIKGDHPSKILFSSFRGADLNVIFYQNMPNLYNQYKLAIRKKFTEKLEYMLNYSLPCSCS